MLMKVWLAVGNFCPDRHHQIWPRFVQIFEQASINLPDLSRPQDWPVKRLKKEVQMACNIPSPIITPKLVRTMQKSPRSKFWMVLIQASPITERDGNLAEKTFFFQVSACK